MRRLVVRAESRTYPILVGRDLLSRVGAEVKRLRGRGQVVVLCDGNDLALYLDDARRSLLEAGLSASHVILPAGEREKSLARAEELYGVLYDRGMRRSDTLLTLGGGVIGDLGGSSRGHVSAWVRVRPGADDPARAGGRVRRG